MKAIILAAGKGTRLYPITKAINNQLLPVYDKPMIYYPLCSVMLCGIRKIFIVVDDESILLYKKLLGDGSDLGIEIEYGIQREPKGIIDAFLIAKDFVGKDRSVLVLGDNMFYGKGFSKALRDASKFKEGALIFGYCVDDPRSYGVVVFDRKGDIVDIEEKPQKPKSNYVVPGFYFYDENVMEYALRLKPSVRQEIEITDLNRLYLKEGKLKLVLLNRDVVWMDMGTCDRLINASNFVKRIQNEEGIYVGCVEEIAYKMGYITKEKLYELGKQMDNTKYGSYLLKIAGCCEHL